MFGKKKRKNARLRRLNPTRQESVKTESGPYIHRHRLLILLFDDKFQGHFVVFMFAEVHQCKIAFKADGAPTFRRN